MMHGTKWRHLTRCLLLCVAAALFLLVNAATIHVFSSMPFKGASGEVARFMY